MSKAGELREMSDDQLTHELRETQENLFRLRFQAATERLDAPSNLTKLRRSIARIKTIQSQRQHAARTGRLLGNIPRPPGAVVALGAKTTSGSEHEEGIGWHRDK